MSHFCFTVSILPVPESAQNILTQVQNRQDYGKVHKVCKFELDEGKKDQQQAPSIHVSLSTTTPSPAHLCTSVRSLPGCTELAEGPARLAEQGRGGQFSRGVAGAQSSVRSTTAPRAAPRQRRLPAATAAATVRNTTVVAHHQTAILIWLFLPWSS